MRVARILLALCVAVAARGDEPKEIARQLYERAFFSDIAGMRKLWRPDIPMPRVTYFSRIPQINCVTVREIVAGEPRISGDHADVPLHAVWSRLDPVNGHEIFEGEHAVIGMERSAGNEWRIVKWSFEEDALVDQMLAAKSLDETTAVMMSRPDLQDWELSRALRLKTYSLVLAGDWDGAWRLAEALRTYGMFNGDDAAYATALNLEGQNMRSRPHPDLDRSLALARESVDVARRSGDVDALGATLNSLGHALAYSTGTMNSSRPLYEEVITMQDRYLSEDLAGTAANRLANYYLDRGDYRAALRYLGIAKKIDVRVQNTGSLYTDEMILGFIFLSENDVELAAEHFGIALDLAKKVNFRIGVIGTQQDLAHCMLLLGRRKEFYALANELIATKDVVPDFLSSIWSDVAADRLQHNQMREADEAIDKAVKLLSESIENERRITTFTTLATLRLAEHRYDDTLAAAKSAIEANAKQETVSGYAPWLISARAHLALGDRKAAYADVNNAIRFAELERAEIAGSERQSALFFESASAAYEMLADLLIGDGRTADALIAAEKAKSRTLLDMLATERSHAEEEMSPAEIAEKKRLEAQLADAPDVTKARNELETFRTMMNAAHSHLRATRGAGTLQSIDSLQQLLPDRDTAIVEYFVTKKRTHAFIIRRGPRIDVRTIPITRKQLDRLVGSFSNAVASRDLSYRKEARRLYQLLLAPLPASARVVCVIPDGSLWRIPFESLIDSSGAFAIEKRTFFYAPSASVLLHARKGEALNARAFLGFGNPRLDAKQGDVLEGEERGTSLAPLPDAEREVEVAARLFGAGSTVHVGDDATESRSKAEAPRYRVIHFATHGVIDDANPMYSHLLLARHPGDGEDGALEAREMLELPLHADLVVLSACDTARGGVHAGEGLIGMSWALFAAGSPSVIASEWRVGSARTETLMSAFYRSWLARKSEPFAKARALRNARLALLHDARFRHPYFWSPFVLIGSPG